MLARILIGVASLIVAFLVAAWFQDPVAGWLRTMHVGESSSFVVAYLLIFVLTMLVGGLVAWAVRRLLKAAMLGWADRLAGMALGVVAAALAAAFVIHPIAASTPWGEDLLGRSKLAPYVSVVADAANLLAPKALSEAYDRKMAKIRGIWRGENPKAESD